MTGAAGSCRRLAVVVITRDRRDQLRRSLERLCSLPEHPAVVLVDNGSRDATPAAVRSEFPGVSVLSLPGNAGAAARNVGVRAARARYVAFADDDSWWAPGALGAATRLMDADPRVALVAGRILVGPDGRPDPTTEAMAAGPLGADLDPSPCGPRAVTGFLACGAVIRTRAFLSVGGFDPALLIGGEEQTVAWDLWASGWRAVHLPDATAVHHPTPGPGRAARRTLLARNDLWAAWSRLPVPSAVSSTLATVGPLLADPAGVVGVGQALRGMRRPLSQRVPIPARVDAPRRRLRQPDPEPSRRTAGHRPRPPR